MREFTGSGEIAQSSVSKTGTVSQRRRATLHELRLEVFLKIRSGFRKSLRVVSLSTLLVAGSASASTLIASSVVLSNSGPSAASFGVEGQYKEMVKRVTAAKDGQYSVILSEYDAYLAVNAGDVVARLDKCLFIHFFSDSEEQSNDAEVSDAEQCDNFLRAPSFSNDGAVQLYLLDQLYGQASAVEAERLLPEAYPWPLPLRARLYEKLADGHRGSDPRLAALELADAVQLDPQSSRRTEVAKQLAKSGARDKALQLMRATPSTAWANLPIYESAQLFVDLGAPVDAAELLRAHPDSRGGLKSTFLLARALSDSGQFSAANEVYRGTLNADPTKWIRGGLVEYFQFAASHGTKLQAVAAYARLRSPGVSGDPWGRFRIALFLRYPSATWAFLDWVGILRITALIACLSLLPALVVCPVHYRSLAKRLRGWIAEPGEWGLATVWYLLAAVLIVPTMALYLLSYDTFASAILWFRETSNASSLDTGGLGRLLIWNSLALGVCAAPLLRRLDLRSFFLGHASLIRTIGWTAVAVVLGAIMEMTYASLLLAYQHIASVGHITTDAILSIQRSYGVVVTLLVISIMVPVIEEVMFRGIILQSLSRYISFRWAAVLQASVFASVHESAQALPYLFVIGLLAAWLVRRTGGLVAPIVLHGVNNAVALGVAMSAVTL